MKKIILLVICTILNTFMCVGMERYTGDPTGERDAFRAGRALIRDGIWYHFKIRLEYENKDGEIGVMYATTNLKLQVVELTINNEEIMGVNDDPLPGIPVLEGGLHNVDVRVDGVTGVFSGQPIIHGNAFIDIVDEDNPIVVTLYPVERLKFVELKIEDIPPGSNPDNLILVTDDGHLLGYYRYWADWAEGFWLYIDYSYSPINVRIEDFYTGEIYEGYGFELDPFEDPIRREEEGVSDMQFNLAGGVHRFLMPDLQEAQEIGYPYYQGPIDGVTNLEGEVFGGQSLYDVPAKTFLLENEEGLDMNVFFLAEDVDSDTWIRITVYEKSTDWEVGIEEIWSVTLAAENAGVGNFEIGGYGDIDGADGDYQFLMILIEVLSGDVDGDFHIHIEPEGASAKS